MEDDPAPVNRGARLAIAVALASCAVGGSALALPASPYDLPGESGWTPARWRLAAQGAAPSKNRQAAPDAPRACKADEQCPEGTTCDEGACRKVERPLNLLYLYYRSGDRRMHEILGLYWHRRGDRGYRVLFPLYWHFWRPEHSSLVIFPLHYGTASKNATRSINLVPPIYYARHGQRHKLIIPPLLYSWGDRASSHLVVFPLFWRWHNKDWQSTTYVAGPFVAQSDPEGNTQVLFPLFWRFEDKRLGSSTSVLFPLAYHSRRADGSRFSMLFPFYYGRGPKHWKAGLLPLLFAGSSHEGSHAVLFPLFWHTQSAKSSTTVLLPGYYRRHERGWSAALVPLLYAGRNGGDSHQVLFPLYWHFRSQERNVDTHVVGPGFHSKSGSGRVFGLFPLFAAGAWKGKRFATVPPLLFYHSRRSDKGTWSLLAGPYYGDRTEKRRLDALFPLFYYRRAHAGGDTVAAVLPLFYYRRTTTGRTVVTPLGGLHSDKRKGLDQGLIGPVLWHRDREQRALVVLPLFVHHRNERTRAETSLLFPLAVRYVSPQETAHVVFPLFWRFTDAKRRSLVIFPLLWQLRQKEGDNIDVLFPLYWRFANARRRLAIAGPVFWHARGTTRTWGAVPLAFYRRHEKGSYFAALPFFYYDHDFAQRRRTWVVALGYFRRYKQGYATGLVPLFFHKRTPEKRHTVLFPIYWRFSSPKEKSSLTIVGPVFHHRKKDHRGWGLAPLFYRASNASGARTTAVAPLFYRHTGPTKQSLYTALFGFHGSKDYAIWYAGTYLHWRSRWRALDVFFPLGFRNHKRKTGESTVFVLPAYYGNWKPGKSVHIVFPLFWRRRTIDAATTVAFPLYWDFHDLHKKRTTALVPFFLRQADYQNKSSWVFTLPALWLRSHQQGTDAVLFPILWRFGKRDGGETVVFPLYWDFKSKRRRSTVFFPLYWRFDRRHSRTTVVLNTYYWRNKRDGTYNFHFFPFVQVQRRRVGDVRVDVLGGLFGYERIGQNRVLTLFFVPIKLEPTKSAPAKASSARRPRTRAVAVHR